MHILYTVYTVCSIRMTVLAGHTIVHIMYGLRVNIYVHLYYIYLHAIVNRYFIIGKIGMLSVGLELQSIENDIAP